MITQTINLNLIPGGVLPRINVSQYDKGARTLQFNLYNGVTPFTIPDGSSVYVVGTKADRTGFDYEATYTGGLVSIDVTEQMTAFAGDVEIEIRIIKSGEQIATGNFVLCVERTALADDTVISETDIPIIQHLPELVAETEENAELAHKWATFGDESEEPSATNNAKYWAEQAEAAQDLTYDTATGNPVSFTTDSSGISRNTIVTLEPKQNGSGDPSPTNVRPISGYDSISITSSGKNMWHGGNVSGTNYNQKAFSLPSGTYTISAVCTSSDTSASVCYVLFLNSVGGGLASVALNRNTRSSATFTLSSDASYARFYASDWDHSSGNTFTFSDIQIEKGSTATTYDAPTTTTINTPSTIYGGTYDVETGELTVNYALADLGEMGWSRSTSYTNPFFYSGVDLRKKGALNTGVCSIYKRIASCAAYEFGANADDNTFAFTNAAGSVQILVRNDAYTDAASFRTAMSGVQLAYELATPYTIQLEPHLSNLFEGQNNVSTNGTQISVTYRNGIVARVDDFNAVGESFEALTGKVEAVEIDKAESSALAPVENGATASKAYAVGDYLYRNGTLYRVTSAIASGATFTVDTNITATTVMAEIVRLTQ